MILFFICVVSCIYGHHTVIDFSPSYLTLEYRKDLDAHDDNYIILPQDSHKKIVLHSILAEDNKVLDLTGTETDNQPVQLSYEGMVHFFHLFRLRISESLRHDNQRHSIQRIEYSIHFSSEIDMKKRPYNSYMAPFFQRHVINFDELPYLVSQKNLPDDIASSLHFFEQEGTFFFMRQSPGFYEIDLNSLREQHPELQDKKLYFYDHHLSQIPSHIYSNRAVFYQPEYEDAFTDKSVVWLFFSPQKIKERLNFPLYIPEYSSRDEVQDYYLKQYSLPRPSSYYFSDKDPDALPDARDAILYHLQGIQSRQDITITLPHRSQVQPETLPLEITLANPHRADKVNYQFRWNNAAIGLLERTNRREEITLHLDIPHDAFTGILHHSLEIINEDAPENVLFLTDVKVQYNKRIRSQDPVVIDTSLQQTGDDLSFPTVYYDYPHVFFRYQESLHRYSYEFNERYNYAGDLLLDIFLPSRTDENGTFYYFPRDGIPRTEPVQFDPPLSSLHEDAQVLLITDPDFSHAAEEYKDIHPEYSITKYYMEDLYNIFSGGLHTPYALRKFLTYKLLSHNEIIPQFAIFLGDCTNDYKNRLNTEIRNYVPTMRYYRGKEGFASDYKLSTLLGEGFYNDIIVARLPFNNSRDFQQYLDKARHYKKNNTSEPWQQRIAYVADDEGFDDYCERLYNKIPPVFETKKIYLKDYLLEDNFYIPWEIAYREKIKVSPDCTRDILDAIQEGVVFSQYMGHGAPNILSHERILFGGDSTNSDFLNLSPNYRPTFMSMMTCSTGAIDYPLPPWNINISEDFLRTKGSGAIALFVPSGKGYPTQHMRISNILQDYIFRKNIRNFGAIISNTLNSYYLEEKNEFHTAMFLLLGDPLLELQLPELEHAIEITPSLAGKNNPDPLHLSTPAAAKNNLPALTLTKRDNFTQQFGHKEYMETPPEKGRYFVHFTQDNVIYYGDFEILDYSADIEKKVLDDFLQQGENTFLVTLFNNSQVPWNNGELHFSLFDEVNQKEVCDFSESIASLSVDSAERYHFPVHLDPGIYSSRLSLTISGVPIYDTSQTWFTPFDPADIPEEPFIMITHQPESQITPDGRASLQFRLFNPMDTSLENIPLYAKIENMNVNHPEHYIPGLEPGKESRWHFETVETLPMDTSKTYVKVSFESDKVNIIPEHVKIPLLQPARLELTSPLKIEPDDPFEGQSLFFNVTVKNSGDKKSSRKMLSFFEEKEGQEKQSIRVNPNAFIPPLEPGEKKSLRFRYSPWGNQGNVTYSVSINDNSGLFHPEHVSKNIYVRRNFRFETHRARTIGPQSEKDKEDRAVYLQAIFSNTGEREAHGVVVNFFRSSSQTPENKIGEIYVDTVEAGETYAISHRWAEVPAGFVRWTFNVGLKVSTARVSHIEEAEHELEDIHEIMDETH